MLQLVQAGAVKVTMEGYRALEPGESAEGVAVAASQ